MKHDSLKGFRKTLEMRGRRIDFPACLPAEVMRTFFEELIGCPDCRAVVLEACNAEDRRGVDIDAVIRDLVLSADH